MFAGVPVEFTNSVVAHAMFHQFRSEDYPPVELGHMLARRGGMPAEATEAA